MRKHVLLVTKKMPILIRWWRRQNKVVFIFTAKSDTVNWLNVNWQLRARVLLRSATGLPLALITIFLSFSAGLSPRSSHDTSLTSRASSAEAVPAHLAPFSTKRMDREFERKLQEVFVSVQLEKVRKKFLFTVSTVKCISFFSVTRWKQSHLMFLRSQQFTTSINNNYLVILPLEQRTACICLEF